MNTLNHTETETPRWPVITMAELERRARPQPRRRGRRVLLAALLLSLGALLVSRAFAQTDASAGVGWSPAVEVRKGKQKAAIYRARLAGDLLIIEVTHESGWHTYALDNEARAIRQAGKPPLGIEKDTHIEVRGGWQVVGKWRQTVPIDLSQPELNWLTWGFEGVAFFAAKVKRHNESSAVVVIINAQACKATMCANVDDLEIKLPPSSLATNASAFDLTPLIEASDFSKIKP